MAQNSQKVVRMQVDGIEKLLFSFGIVCYPYCTKECISLVQEMFISVPASVQLSVFSLILKDVSTVPLSNPAQGCIVHSKLPLAAVNLFFLKACSISIVRHKQIKQYHWSRL